MRRGRNAWSSEDIMAAVRQRADGADMEDIAIETKRSLKSVKCKLRDIEANTIEGAKRVLRDGVAKRDYQPHFVAQGPSITPEADEAREQNYIALAQRNLTATLFGDPPAGRSALDQRKAREAAAQ